jgi:UDP-N-acetylmuramate dehydrogenase
MHRLADLTTLRLGGPAQDVIDCTDQGALIAAIQRCDADRHPVLVLGGGSNVVVADAGFRGTVIRVLTAGIDVRTGNNSVAVTAQAGESWDDLVDRCIKAGMAGIECLAGIPGSVGATPIQNVGAYGQDVAQTIRRVVAYDRTTRAIQTLSSEECRFSYRSSMFKQQSGRWLVLEVTFDLKRCDRSQAVRYAELARSLGIAVGETAPLQQAREAVLNLRRAKGMVLDPTDPDTVSAGSFFLNPILEPAELARLRDSVHARCGAETEPPVFPGENGKLKTSAAWLMERAGFHRGYGSPDGIAISSKHTLALTNRGRGTTAELIKLAREIAGRVRAEFGVELEPEPVFVGQSWSLP